MNVEQSFQVPASPQETYGLLVDLERVGGCIPGGEVGPAGEDGSHPASIAVKVGPMRMSYKGKVQIVEADEASRRAVLQADVREQRGQGTAKATMRMTVSPRQDGSLVETVTEVALTGRAAHMGQGVIREVADRLVGEMASCIAAKLQSKPAAAEVAATATAGSQAGKAAAGAATAKAGSQAAGEAAAGKPAGQAASGSRASVEEASPGVQQAKPIKGLTLMARVIWGTIKRALTGKRG